LPEASTDVRAATRRADPHLTHRYDAVRLASAKITLLAPLAKVSSGQQYLGAGIASRPAFLRLTALIPISVIFASFESSEFRHFACPIYFIASPCHSDHGAKVVFTSYHYIKEMDNYEKNTRAPGAQRHTSL
jgi:hypothetical protein